MLGRNLPQPAPIEHTRVGHDDIEAAELFDRFGHHPLLAGQVSDVDGFGEDLAALAFDQADRFGEVFRRRGGIAVVLGHRCARVDRDDVGTGPGQPDTVRPALATGGSGHVRDLAGQRIFTHADSSFARGAGCGHAARR